MRIGRASSVLAARTTWRRASPTAAAGNVTDDVVRRGQLRVVVERQRSHAELRTTATDVDFVALDGDLDLAGAHRAHDVGREASGEHDATIAIATHGQRQLDRQIEIGASDAQLVADEFEAQPRQHRERPSAAGCGTSCSGERFGEGLRVRIGTSQGGLSHNEVMYKGNNGNKGCGLCISR